MHFGSMLDAFWSFKYHAKTSFLFSRAPLVRINFPFQFLFCFRHRSWPLFFDSLCCFIRKYDLGTPSKSRGRQNGTPNRPSGRQQLRYFEKALASFMEAWNKIDLLMHFSCPWFTFGTILIPMNTKMLPNISTGHQNANKNISRKSLFRNAFWVRKKST